jgi:hypothetical protein
MTSDALGHLLVARFGGGDEDDAATMREPLDGEAALSAPGAAHDEE